MVLFIMWKNVVDRQATDDNTMFCRKDALYFACCITEEYRHKPTIFNTY